MRNSIRTRLIIAFIGLAIGPLLLVGVILAWQSFVTQQQQALNLQRQVAQRVATQVTAFFEQQENQLRLVSQVQGLQQLDRDQQRRLLLRLLSYQNTFEELVLLDSQGREQIYLARLGLTSADLNDRAEADEFALPQTTGQVYYSPVRFDEISGEPLMTIAIPLLDVRTGQVDGVLIAETRLKRIWDLIAGMRVSPGQTVYIVDAQGDVVAHRNPSVVLRGTHLEVSDQDGLQPGLTGSRTVLAVDTARFGEQAFHIVAEQAVFEALAPAIHSMYLILAVILAALLVAGVLGVLMVRQIVQPIQVMAATAEAISTGDLSQQVELTRQDELGILADAFNSMTRELRHLITGLEQQITERRRTEESLSQTNEKLQALIDYSPLAIVMFDLESNILLWNNAAERKYGWTAQEVLGKSSPTVPQEKLKEHRAIHERVISGETVKNLEVARKCKDGSTVFIDVSVAPLRNSAGNIYAMMSIGMDITERKQAEEALRLTQLAVDRARDAIHWVGADGELLYVNDATCQSLGYTREELLSMTVFDIDPLHAREIWAEQWQRPRETGYYMIESVHKTKDGRLFPVEVAIDRVNHADKEFNCAYARDITERKQAEAALRESEQKFRTVVQNAQAIIFILDSNGVFLLSEGQALAKLGLMPGQVVGLSAFELYQDNPSVIEGIRGALAGEVTHVTNVVQDVVFDTVYSPYYDLEGRPTGLIGIAIDITERKQAEEALHLTRFTVESVADAVYWIDPEARIVDVNEAACRMLGYTREKLTRMSLSDIDPGFSIDQWPETWKYLKERGKQTREAKHCTQEGQIIPVEIVANFIEFGGRELDCAFVRDITERKKAEEALRLTQQAVDRAWDAIHWVGPDGQLLYVNEATCQSLGYTREELLSMTVFDIDPLYPKETWADHWENERDLGHYKLESVHKTKDGRLFPVEIVVDRVNYTGQEFNCAYARDITERKRAEQIIQLRLRLMEFAATHSLAELLQKTLDEVGELTNSPIGFYHFVEADQKTLSLQAWSTRTLAEFCQAEGEGLHYPIDEAGVWVDCVRERRPVIHNDYQSLPHRQGLPEGHTQLIRELVVPIFRDDRIMAILGIGNKPQDYTETDAEVASYVADLAWEITERKRTEDGLKQNQALLDESQRITHIGSWDMDLKTHQIIWTDEAFRIFGYRPQEFQPSFEIFSNCVHPDDQGMLPDHYREMLATKKFREFDYRVVWPDGTVRWIHATGKVYTDDAGVPVRTIGTVQDITERRQAEEKIRLLNTELEQRVAERTAQLEAANKELEAFSYSVSHDLRAPLRAIDGYTRILLEDYETALDTEGQRVCAVIRHQTQWMGQLIDDLLAFSRLSRVDIRVSSIDMEDLANAVFQEVTTFEDRERIDFQVESLPPAVGDPTLIRQVWTNLLANAVKFSSKRKRAVIGVGSRQETAENIYFVRDNGAGFDMQYADKLFGVFQRLHSERDFEGTGVGLAITQRLIHRHGGRVWAESKIDQGATFYFSLPRKVN